MIYIIHLQGGKVWESETTQMPLHEGKDSGPGLLWTLELGLLRFSEKIAACVHRNSGLFLLSGLDLDVVWYLSIV